MKDLGFVKNVVGTKDDKNHHIYEITLQNGGLIHAY